MRRVCGSTRPVVPEEGEQRTRREGRELEVPGIKLSAILVSPGKLLLDTGFVRPSPLRNVEISDGPNCLALILIGLGFLQLTFPDFSSMSLMSARPGRGSSFLGRRGCIMHTKKGIECPYLFSTHL